METGPDSQTSSDIFVPPSQGADPVALAVKKNPLLAGLHVATGDFPKALDLLRKQLALANPEPLKQLFVDVFTLTRTKLQTMPHIPPLDYQLRSNQHLPQMGLNLRTLTSKYSKAVDLTTKGEFSQALDAYRQCLHCVPLTIVTSHKEQKELTEMVRKVAEYVTAMRIELERKRLLSQVNAIGVNIVYI